MKKWLLSRHRHHRPSPHPTRHGPSWPTSAASEQKARPQIRRSLYWVRPTPASDFSQKNRFLRYVKDVTWMEKTYMNIILKKHMKTCSSPVLVDFRWILDGCWWTLKEKKMAVVLADRQESPHLKDGLVHRYGVQLPQGVLSCSPSRQDSGGKLRKTGWKLDEDWLIPIFFFGNLRLCSNMSTTNHTSIKAISCFVLLRRWSCWFEEMSIWIHYPSLAVTSNFKQD